MKIMVDNMPPRGRCRFCKAKARWDLMRVISKWETRHSSVCDTHLGTGLRNAGLAKLSIEQTAIVSAEIQP